MANEFLGAKALDENISVSEISGMSDRPEVKDVMGWLGGKYNTGNDFRDMALDDVIAKRTSLPEDKYGNLSPDREGDGLTKVGEFFYSVKDSFASAMEDIPLNVINYGASAVKYFDKDNETATDLLETVSTVRQTEAFNKSLRDFRLGVESDALSNELGSVIGLMGTLILGGAAAGGGKAGMAVAAAGEGLAEGGQFLQKTIDDASEKKGGLEAYNGEGLEAATAYGVGAGLIGLYGVEAQFLDKLGKFTGKDFLKGVAGEALEEGAQFALERGVRRTDNAIRGTTTDDMSALEEFKAAGKNMLLGAMGGATIGGIAVVSNRKRAEEILQDNFGLTEQESVEAVDEYMTDLRDSVRQNADALKTIKSPESPVGQEIRKAVQLELPLGAPAELQEKIAKEAQDIIIMNAAQGGTSVAESPVLSENADEAKLAIQDAVVQAKAHTDALTNAEAQAKEDLAALESEQVEPEKQEEQNQKITQKQAEINAIREMNGEPAEYSVGENVNAEQIEELKNELNSVIMQQTEMVSPDPNVSVGATLENASNAEYDARFDTGKKRVSNFTARLSKETGEAPSTYQQRDTKAADTAADRLVVADEARAIKFLRDRTLAQIDGLSKPEILEALYRQNRGNPEKLAELEEFSFIATQAGRDVQAFSESDPWDARARIRDINNQIAREAPKPVKERVASEKKAFKEALKVKKDRLPSDKEIERMTRELLGCK